MHSPLQLRLQPLRPIRSPQRPLRLRQQRPPLPPGPSRDSCCPRRLRRLHDSANRSSTCRLSSRHRHPRLPRRKRRHSCHRPHLCCPLPRLHRSLCHNQQKQLQQRRLQMLLRSRLQWPLRWKQWCCGLHHTSLRPLLLLRWLQPSRPARPTWLWSQPSLPLLLPSMQPLQSRLPWRKGCAAKQQQTRLLLHWLPLLSQPKQPRLQRLTLMQQHLQQRKERPLPLQSLLPLHPLPLPQSRPPRPYRSVRKRRLLPSARRASRPRSCRPSLRR